jgi:5-methyltetrahydrofolate--homocysteine methyltransferase
MLHGVSMSDYHMQEYVREMNFAAARLAREAADEYTAKTPDKPRFVADRSSDQQNHFDESQCGRSDVSALTFDELKAAYREQIEALMEGEVDLLLVEPFLNTLNAKALFLPPKKRCATRYSHHSFGNLSDKAGRTLSGQTLWLLLRR